jgi:exodeoxyribonuclease V alpha subunit
VIEVDKIVIVEFEGKEVEYEFTELLELDLAYAVSVHKYQGSESPCIILPIHESYNRLLFRNLLYTGITRGKRLVILVGTKEAVSTAIRNNKAHKRYTGLVAMLQQKENGLPIIQIVPMLGSVDYEDWVIKNFGDGE